MIQKGTVLEIGQQIHKVRKGGKLLKYHILEVIEKLNDTTYNCVIKGGKRKTIYIKISKSEDLFITKFDFLSYVVKYIALKKEGAIKFGGPILHPTNYISNQVIGELNASQNKFPEYWI